jgi:uncharacterized membrane protein YgdD (TMEM256/DUF423 family)
MLGSRSLVFLAAVSCFIAVGIGAMGSHSLPKRLKDAGLDDLQVQKKLGQCEIAVKYQMYHSLAVLSLGLCPATAAHKSWQFAGLLFFVGMGLFSGGLYSMVFFDQIGHWSIVPLGGATMMLSWLIVAIGAIFPNKSLDGTGKLLT